jgi:hypothetical protein
MRGLWLLPPLLLAACAGPGQERSCAGAFTLSNQSGREVEQLYAGSQQDLLEPGTMPSGGQRSFFAVNPVATQLRVVFADGRAVELGPVNLCALPHVVINAAGLSANPP